MVLKEKEWRGASQKAERAGLSEDKLMGKQDSQETEGRAALKRETGAGEGAVYRPGCRYVPSSLSECGN